jgi:outer membrane protein assembly factor BamB
MKKLLPLLLLGLVFSPIPSLATIGAIGWFFETGDTIFSSPAVDADGNIYFGSRDGKVYSLTAAGTKRWEFAQAEDWVDGSPALSDDGVLYIGSWDNHLYALEMATGALKWKFEAGNLVMATPAIGPDGRIYFGTYDGVFYALEANGTTAWSRSLGAEIEGSASIDAEGNIYVGTTAGTVFCLSLEGDEVWQYDLSTGITAEEHGVYGAPAIGPNGTVYVGSRNGGLFAFDPSGIVLWRFAATDYIDASPVVDAAGNIYFAARDGYLYKVNPSGIAEWELLVGDVFYASPVLGEDGLVYQVAYAGDDLSTVLAIDADGETVAQQILPLYNDASLTFTPGGDLLIGMFDGAMYALPAQTTLSSTAAWPKFAFDTGQTGSLAEFLPGDPAVVAAFPGVEAFADDWYFLTWLGWFEGGKFPWVLHIDHGWLWVGNASSPNYWFYDLKLGWLYLSVENPDLFFRGKTGTWLLYLEGSSVYDGGRWFFDYGTMTWFLDTTL